MRLEKLIQSVRQPNSSENGWYETYNETLLDLDTVMLDSRVFPKQLYIPWTAFEYSQEIFQACHDRKFCVTNKGYYGIVQQRAKAGIASAFLRGLTYRLCCILMKTPKALRRFGRAISIVCLKGRLWNGMF